MVMSEYTVTIKDDIDGNATFTMTVVSGKNINEIVRQFSNNLEYDLTSAEHNIAEILIKIYKNKV